MTEPVFPGVRVIECEDMEPGTVYVMPGVPRDYVKEGESPKAASLRHIREFPEQYGKITNFYDRP